MEEGLKRKFLSLGEMVLLGDDEMIFETTKLTVPPYYALAEICSGFSLKILVKISFHLSIYLNIY